MTDTPISSLRLLELLSSKICHDLISPIGAVNNGIEFMEEMGPEAYDDAKDLIAYSAAQASAKLQAYRLAFGGGGADMTHKPEDIHKVIDPVIVPGGKLTQDWDPLAFTHLLVDGMSYPTGLCKMLAALLLLAAECLPRMGTISAAPQSANPKTIDITARGQGASVRGSVAEALTLDIAADDLHAKTMHPYFCGLMAQNYGFTLGVDNAADDVVTFTLVLP